MTRHLFRTLAALSLAALPLSAQGDRNDGTEGNRDRLGFNRAEKGESRNTHGAFWTCIIGNADTAITTIKLSTITSISKQTYLLEGTQRILEVTIDTTGNNSIRFYSLASAHAGRVASNISNARELLDRHTEQASRLPSKKYPEATHSHNIEYQLSSPEQINCIYESVTHSWLKNTGANLRLSN